MLGKNHYAAVMLAVLALSATALIIPEAVFALAPPEPTSIGLNVYLTGQPVAAGCPSTYIVQVTPLGGFEGETNLTVVDPPAGVTATFNPNPVDVPISQSVYSVLTVKVTPDVPQRLLNLTLKAEGFENGRIINNTRSLFLGVASPCEPPKGEEIISTTTVTTTVTTTLPATLTGTITTQLGEQPPDTTYAWAVSATVATIVLAMIVLLLQRRTK